MARCPLAAGNLTVMSVLTTTTTISPDDAEALAAVVASAAAAGDARAACWLLEHHPQHRLCWGNQEQIRNAVGQVVRMVCAVIDSTDTLSSDDARERLLLQLVAAGVGIDIARVLERLEPPED